MKSPLIKWYIEYSNPVWQIEVVRLDADYFTLLRLAKTCGLCKKSNTGWLKQYSGKVDAIQHRLSTVVLYLDTVRMEQINVMLVQLEGAPAFLVEIMQSSQASTRCFQNL